MVPVAEFVEAVRVELVGRGEPKVFRFMAREARDGRMAFHEEATFLWAPSDSVGVG